ncbi:PREDICTED: putative serine/threonine-protein kinase isoform X2 [Nicotiana attenuata]|uniref:Lrr receptor-like serinethreonine-protein kinase n=1 Tax=Nicotiana attenuata TaxID=49451 RepID=A0A1J6J7A1_NICAT|nr:PREDICTED: putative serine/threonine-protein kinase isoform X2 [Nicotiana attenuata]XP_019223604.1 PREDICTED: putative serine/threonine-protein kinase isoform X2 [Nicotiana attenuata]OIT05719.1 putative lrr receptor-like serinethreonine-protein kinase [Nicotiana attenuata]
MSCCFFGARKKGGDLVHHDTRDTRGRAVASTKNFSFSELRIATNNFHQTNKIGRGGFGTVYKGTLKSGKEIAVKTLAAESKQGLREFLTEIETISNVRHPNLVEIIGCCADGNNRILVYEYLVNRSLDQALFGSRISIKLEWDKRAAICLGTAQGLAYLHEELVPHIVHRDIKASNILLDKDYTPKIGDFGLAKLFPDNITHISTKIAGTTGYLAPEYVLGGQLTMKADVYSFGVLILETISGRSSSSSIWRGDKKSLLGLAWQLYQDAKLLDLVDEELDDFPEKEVVRYIKVALFCTQANANRRPMMSQVIEMLSRNIQLNEKELTPPGFFQDSDASMLSKLKSSECSTSQQSSVPLTITQVTPR